MSGRQQLNPIAASSSKCLAGGTGPRWICLGSMLRNSLVWLALLSLLVSSCFAVLHRLGSGWVQSSPTPLPGERSHTVCGCAGLGQFAALWDQPGRKAQRGSGFASPKGAIALVSPASYGVDLAPPEAIAWLGRRHTPQRCPAGP